MARSKELESVFNAALVELQHELEFRQSRASLKHDEDGKPTKDRHELPREQQVAAVVGVVNGVSVSALVEALRADLVASLK